MTTKFSSVEACLQEIAEATGTSIEEVEEAWSASEKIYIGWPHNQDAEAFWVGGQRFAIADFRDGKAVWSISPSGMMFRW